MNACPHCGADVPVVTMTAPAWRGVIDALERGSRTIAEAEIFSLGLADRADAKRFIDHVKACVYSWPFEAEVQAILHDIDQAFGTTPRPEHFTNFKHCFECAEADEMLLSRTVKTITRDDIGDWASVFLLTDEGWAYYFPALARFAVIPNIWGRQEYDFGRDLSARFPRLDFFTREQRFVIATLMEWIAAHGKQKQL